jgi:uncharacterized membrane protein required for colicin V production
MIWIDLLAIVIIIAAAYVESERQFGSSFFDMVAILASLHLAKLLGPVFAHAIHVFSAADNNQAFGIALLFVVFAAPLLVLAKFVQDQALLTIDAFDAVAGAIFGLVSGIAIANIVLIIILTANPASTPWGAAVRKRPAVQQIVHFQAYNTVLDHLRHLGE